MDEPIEEQIDEQEPSTTSVRDLLMEIELDATLQFGLREMLLSYIHVHIFFKFVEMVNT